MRNITGRDFLKQLTSVLKLKIDKCAGIIGGAVYSEHYYRPYKPQTYDPAEPYLLLRESREYGGSSLMQDINRQQQQNADTQNPQVGLIKSKICKAAYIIS